MMAGKIRLLFVDDEKDFVAYMTKRLKLHDLEVDAYTHPVEALEKTEGHTYDVALLDLRMPEMDGEQLLGRLKQRDPSIEIIILTGHGSIESAFRSAKVGAYEYLLKPCDFDELVTSINKAYAKRIRSLGDEKAKQVDALMRSAGTLQPMALLKQLKKINDGMEMFMAAAALADGGDPESAKELMGQENEEKKKKKG
jgi:DNA-binding NtrC family response regulator